MNYKERKTLVARIDAAIAYICTTKLVVRTSYKNADYGASIVDVYIDNLPLDVAPGMVCQKLNKIPKPGEIIYLGSSDRHYSPSDVMVALATQDLEKEINKIYSASPEKLAEMDGVSVQDVYKFGDSNYANAMVGEIVDKYLRKFTP